MTVSDYIADFLVKKGIKDIFFVDGSAVASMLVAVAKNKKLKYYCPLHEQAGAFMQDGYYKATHKLSAMFATSGPGGQNLVNGIAASYYDSIPALYFTGQINSRFIKPNNFVRQHGFQEHDVVSMVRDMVKYAVMITDPNKIKYELGQAYHMAVSNRPGPVLIDVPMDIQRAEVDTKKLEGYIFSGSTYLPPPDLALIIELLQKAKRPAILLGGGVWLSKAVSTAKKLARKLKKVPFFITWNMMDYYDPMYCGGKIGTFGGDGRNFGIQNCDFLLSIGSRISGRVTGGIIDTFARGAKKVIVDIDPKELQYKQLKADINVCCDAGVFMENLLKSGIKLKADTTWLTQVMEWKKKYPIIQSKYYKQKKHVNPYVFVKTLSECMQKGDILVHEAGGNCVITSQAFEAKDRQRVFTNNGNSSLGYALPAAIGAVIATKKKVICILGDGGMNFNIQELQTIWHYNLPIKVFIFNNKAFGITKAYRDTHFNSEYAGVDAKHGISFPNFVKVAEAYKLSALRITNQTNLKQKIENILTSNGPIICDIDMEGFYEYQPKLGWGAPIEMQYPYISKKEFIKNMIIEPIEGWEKVTYPGIIK